MLYDRDTDNSARSLDAFPLTTGRRRRSEVLMEGFLEEQNLKWKLHGSVECGQVHVKEGTRHQVDGRA